MPSDKDTQESPKWKKKPQEERRPPLDNAKKQHMLAVCLRNQEAFESVQELLTVAAVRKWSAPMALVWREARKFYGKYGELADRGQLNAEMHNEMGGNIDLLGKEEQEEIDEFLKYAWDADEFDPKRVGKSKKYVSQAVETARQFLEEMVATQLQHQMSKEGTLPLHIPKFLEETQAALDQVASLTDVGLDVPYPEGWDKKADNQMFTTGVETLDEFTGGGWRPGETILFMAPYGSCKTTLVCHAVANLLRYAAGLLGEGKTRKNAKGEPMIPVVVLIFTESDKDEYRDRIMSAMAGVPWSRLREMDSIDDLDDGSEPGDSKATKYEKSFFKEDIENNKPWFSEQQRVRYGMKLANKHLLILDCTDSDDTPHKVGRGGISEIANIVRGEFRKRRDTHYPLCFWLDHVSGLVDRMTDNVTDEAIIRRAIMNAPRQAADKLGKPFKAPIGLMHQFSGAAQNKGVVANLHHNDAEGSKAIGKYAVFAVVCGDVDGNGMCKWECTKHRRRPASPVRIVKVVGDFSKLVDCTHTHGISPGQRMIMSKTEMGSVGKIKAPKGMKASGNVNPFVGMEDVSA